MEEWRNSRTWSQCLGSELDYYLFAWLRECINLYCIAELFTNG